MRVDFDNLMIEVERKERCAELKFIKKMPEDQEEYIKVKLSDKEFGEFKNYINLMRPYGTQPPFICKARVIDFKRKIGQYLEMEMCKTVPIPSEVSCVIHSYQCADEIIIIFLTTMPNNAVLSFTINKDVGTEHSKATIDKLLKIIEY